MGCLQFTSNKSQVIFKDYTTQRFRTRVNGRHASNIKDDYPITAFVVNLDRGVVVRGVWNVPFGVTQFFMSLQIECTIITCILTGQSRQVLIR